MSNSDDAAVFLTWITLSRVAEGNVTKRSEHYLDGGDPFPPYLVASIATLITEGALAVADPDPAGWQQISITEIGQARHEALHRRGAHENAPLDVDRGKAEGQPIATQP